jgi:hypothetical protein
MLEADNWTIKLASYISHITFTILSVILISSTE